MWFRFHVGSTEDFKFRVVSRNAHNAGVTVSVAIALWQCVLEDGAAAEHRGIATRGAAFYAIVLDLDETVIAAAIEQFKALGMLSGTGADLAITNWAKRQFETDQHDPTNAERQRRYRQRKRANGENVGVTDDSVTNNGNGNARNDQAKRPETEQNRTDFARARASKDARRSWNGEGEKLIARIGEAAFERKFLGCWFEAGPPRKVIAPSARFRNEILGKYGQTLVDLFGADVIVACAGEAAA